MVGYSVQIITPIRRVNVPSKELSLRSPITHCLKRSDQTHIRSIRTNRFIGKMYRSIISLLVAVEAASGMGGKRIVGYWEDLPEGSH